MNWPSEGLFSPTGSIDQTSTRTARRGGLRLPKYRLHEASGQAVVTLAGKDHYLGSYDTPASRQKYARVIAEWEANNRRVPVHASHPKLTVCVLIDAFWVHTKNYYRKADGSPAIIVSER